MLLNIKKEKELISIKKTKGLLLGFLFGSVIGGAIALLYAPKSGKQLRKDIGNKANELIEDGKKITSDSWNEVKVTAENTYNGASDFINAGVEKITRKTDKVKDALKSGYNSYNDERKSGNNQKSSVIEDADNTSNQIK